MTLNWIVRIAVIMKLVSRHNKIKGKTQPSAGMVLAKVYP